MTITLRSTLKLCAVIEIRLCKSFSINVTQFGKNTSKRIKNKWSHINVRFHRYCYSNTHTKKRSFHLYSYSKTHTKRKGLHPNAHGCFLDTPHLHQQFYAFHMPIFYIQQYCEHPSLPVHPHIIGKLSRPIPDE